ncbi:MAG TPA: MFS transporter [Microbacterium sp.]|nr:MFS transporter [Microbacterium sp.]
MTDPLDQAPATKKEVRTVIASSVVGTTVEWYDFFLYGTAAGIVFNKLYFPSEDPLVGTLLAFATFAVGFVARPVGGLIFGHIGDRVGRKKTLVATMLIMGVATMLIGLVPTYDAIGAAAPVLLVLLRLAQGIAIGGEWGGAVLMAVEYSPPGKRGLYGSLPQVGLALGLLLGTGTFAGLSAAMTDEAFMAWGWRVAFLLSAVLVLIGLFIRLKVMETPAFRKLEAREETAKVPALELIQDRRCRRHVLLGMGSRWAEGVAFNTWAVFAIAYGADTLGMDRNTMLIAVMIAAATMLVFIPVFGHWSDRLDRRKTFAFGVVTVALLAYPAFLLVGTKEPVLVTLAVVVVLGVFYPAMYGPQSSLYAEMFPTHVRYSGISFVYQFSGIFASGLTPLVLTYLLGLADGGIQYVGAYVIAVSVVSAACVLAIRGHHLSLDENMVAGPVAGAVAS